MPKCALLTCQDLSKYVSDEELLLIALRKQLPLIEFTYIPWDAPIDWNLFDWAIVRTTWDYTKRLDEFVAVIQRIKSSSCQLFNSADIIVWNSRKTYLADLEKKNIPIIPTVFLGKNNLDSLASTIASWPQDRVALKPVVGANSSQIQILLKKQANDVGHDLAQRQTGEWFIQPFLAEIAQGETSYHFFNKKFSHAIRKVPKPGDFRVQEEHGAEILSYQAQPWELTHAQNTVDAIAEDLLYARVDAVAFKQSWLLMELELIEPSLYFRTDLQSANRFAQAFSEKIS